jgi:Pentapeptide repeats (8 copies)
MNTDQDESQEAPSPVRVTPPSTNGRLQDILAAHQQWVQTSGKEGKRAELAETSLARASLRLVVLSEANLQGADLFEANLADANLAEATLQGANLYLADLRGADVQRASLQRALVKEANLQEANLHGANLHSADLQGADLQGSNLQDATLHHTNLRDLDLSGTTGLLTPQLAGAIIAGVKLPARLQAFDGLTTVKVLVKQSRKLLTLLCLGCACAWLVLASTTDAMLLTNASAALLPHLSIPIPSQTFARVMPVLLLGLFIYLHLHLHRLWAEFAELPAVFPDGRSLDKTAYPWFFHSIVGAHVWCLRLHRPPLSRLCTVLTIGLAWWLVPGTLALFWIRYLPAHDWLVTILHMTLLVASIGLAIFFHLKVARKF